MLYTKNINDLQQLQSEQKRLKVLYAQALNNKDDAFTLQRLRKRIKLLAFRIGTIGFFR